MKNRRRVTQVRSHALLFAVVLSPSLFQVDYSCERGNTLLSSLEIEVSGQNQIVGFNPTNRDYAITTSVSSASVTVVTQDPASIASYRWFVNGTAIGLANGIGAGGGQVTVTAPDGESELHVSVRAQEGAFDSYIINVNNLGDAVTKTIPMVCDERQFSDISTPYPASFELTVDPLSPAIAGQPFDVRVTGYAGVSEFVIGIFANQFLMPPPHRVAILSGSVDVAVRSGASGPRAFLSPAPTSWSCTLDENGNFGAGAGPYPSCDPANDIPGSEGPTGLPENADCLVLGANVPDNPCVPFVALTFIDGTSDACQACAALGLPEEVLCDDVGYCLTVDARAFPLSSAVETYVADADATEVIFGFSPPDSMLLEPGPADGLRWVLQFDDTPLLANGILSALIMEYEMVQWCIGPPPSFLFSACSIPDEDLVSIPVEIAP